ncbi:hypothetical protein Tsp_06867, partial [Trichinella spiralis]|uniref:hypothetical protein n=1 Tax=Trichinella spiralis TaxID=6334 RepID=UPI0001EFC9E8
MGDPRENRMSFLVLLREFRNMLRVACVFTFSSLQSNYSASCTQRTFYNATTCHVSQTNECALTDDKAPFMAIVICIAQRWKP